VFDDGVIGATPGDKDFTQAGIRKELKRLGPGYTADYCGVTEPPPPPPPEPPPTEAGGAHVGP
jgi:hypothetical protein